MADICKIGPGHKVLDVGCGIGGSCIWLARNTGALLTGININDKQIEVAKKIIDKNNLNVNDKVKILKKDYMKTGFSKESFDVVWGLESICHAIDKQEFLAEAYRILKKEGRIIIGDGFIRENNLSIKDKHQLDKWLEGWAVPNIPSISQFKKCLKKSGFNNIKGCAHPYLKPTNHQHRRRCRILDRYQ